MLWMIAMAAIAQQPPGSTRELATWLSLAYPVWYVALSAWLGGWGRPRS